MSVLAPLVPVVARKLWKQVRRYRDLRESAASLDVRTLEPSMMYALFIRTAEELGLSYRRVGPMLCIEDADAGMFRLVANSTEIDPLPICELCGDKVTTCELLRDAGLSVPRGRAFADSDVAKAIRYADELGGSCVVKPAVGTSAETGITVGVDGPAALRRAFQRASLYGSRILVEEYVRGDDYRFLVYRGTCISVLRRCNPTVTGNGRDTVAALIAEENASRIRGNEWHVGDPIWMPIGVHRDNDLLRAQGLTFRSTPTEGREVVVGRANYRFGGTHEEVIQSCHATVLDAAERAARAMSVELAGVDVLSEDITQSDYRIIEINTTPALWFHYFISNREMCRDPIRTILRDRLRGPNRFEAPTGMAAGVS